MLKLLGTIYSSPNHRPFFFTMLILVLFYTRKIYTKRCVCVCVRWMDGWMDGWMNGWSFFILVRHFHPSCAISQMYFGQHTLNIWHTWNSKSYAMTFSIIDIVTRQGGIIHLVDHRIVVLLVRALFRLLGKKGNGCLEASCLVWHKVMYGPWNWNLRCPNPSRAKTLWEPLYM